MPTPRIVSKLTPAPIVVPLARLDVRALDMSWESTHCNLQVCNSSFHRRRGKRVHDALRVAQHLLCLTGLHAHYQPHLRQLTRAVSCSSSLGNAGREQKRPSGVFVVCIILRLRVDEWRSGGRSRCFGFLGSSLLGLSAGRNLRLIVPVTRLHQFAEAQQPAAHSKTAPVHARQHDEAVELVRLASSFRRLLLRLPPPIAANVGNLLKETVGQWRCKLRQWNSASRSAGQCSTAKRTSGGMFSMRSLRMSPTRGDAHVCVHHR